MVRVRFAPSPTGNLHVGNGRTAVLNYLFARRNRGRFVLRIEDTDLERSEALFEDSIRDDLAWLDLSVDEGPYRQSERLDVYRDYAGKLLDKGLAYKCFCSKEELEKARADAQRLRMPPRYGRTCRNLTAEAVRGLEAQGRPFVLRFKSLERKIAFRDAIHGEMEFPADHVDDFIIMRTDGVAVLQLRRRGGRSLDGYHPRHQGERPSLEHAEADHALPRLRAVAARICPPLAAHGQRQETIEQEARRHDSGGVQGHGHPAGGHGELPGHYRPEDGQRVYGTATA